MRSPSRGEIEVWVGRTRRDLVSDVLARYARDLRVIQGEHGKPELRSGEVQFNLSHSGGLTAVAVAAEPVGVDLEHERSQPDPLRFAQRFLAPSEASAIEALPRSERAAALLRLWTAKESYVKALGTGLATPMRSFAVAAGPRVAETHDGSAPADWSMAALGVPRGYAGTVALRGALRRVRCFDAL